MYPGKIDSNCYENGNDHHWPLQCVIATQFCNLFDLIAKYSAPIQFIRLICRGDDNSYCEFWMNVVISI